MSSHVVGLCLEHRGPVPPQGAGQADPRGLLSTSRSPSPRARPRSKPSARPPLRVRIAFKSRQRIRRPTTELAEREMHRCPPPTAGPANPSECTTAMLKSWTARHATKTSMPSLGQRARASKVMERRRRRGATPQAHAMFRFSGRRHDSQRTPRWHIRPPLPASPRGMTADASVSARLNKARRAGRVRRVQRQQRHISERRHLGEAGAACPRPLRNIRAARSRAALRESHTSKRGNGQQLLRNALRRRRHLPASDTFADACVVAPERGHEHIARKWATLLLLLPPRLNDLPLEPSRNTSDSGWQVRAPLAITIAGKRRIMACT